MESKRVRHVIYVKALLDLTVAVLAALNWEGARALLFFGFFVADIATAL
jgi:hypothetical protein